MRLSSRRLAQWIGVTEDRIERLLALGLIRSGPDGRFSGDDVHTVRLVLAMEDAGIDVAVSAEAAAHHAIDLDSYPDWFPAKPVNPGRPFGEFAADLGVDAERLRSVYRKVGLPEPDPSRRIAEDEQSIVWQLLDIADVLGDVELFRRALTAFTQAAGLAVERTLALYSEHVDGGEEDSKGPDSIGGGNHSVEAWAQLSRLSPHLLAWLCRRHLETALDSMTVVRTERFLAEHGYVQGHTEEPEAVVFVDISGYTTLAEIQGDRLSALLGAGVGDLAAEVTERCGGRLVKLLGDGAMLHFPKVDSAVVAAVELIGAAREAGLPPLHVGVNHGPMVYRDGDYYGHTVNTAARLASAAPAGTIYATSEAAARASADWMPVGPVMLKGISQPIEVFAIRPAG
jgi:adenylate cyclase